MRRGGGDGSDVDMWLRPDMWAHLRETFASPDDDVTHIGKTTRSRYTHKFRDENRRRTPSQDSASLLASGAFTRFSLVPVYRRIQHASAV